MWPLIRRGNPEIIEAMPIFHNKERESWICELWIKNRDERFGYAVKGTEIGENSEEI